MSISQWPVDDRPREKLSAKGPKALTDAELLAIFLRVGCKGVNAKQMAQELIDYFAGLGPLLKSDMQSFWLTIIPVETQTQAELISSSKDSRQL